jgi:hypothetical protein
MRSVRSVDQRRASKEEVGDVCDEAEWDCGLALHQSRRCCKGERRLDWAGCRDLAASRRGGRSSSAREVRRSATSRCWGCVGRWAKVAVGEMYVCRARAACGEFG